MPFDLSEYESVSNSFPIWRPEKEGDSITGFVATIQEITTGFGNAKRIILVDDMGRRWSIILSAVLQNAFNNLEIKKDDLIRITYNGEKKGKNKRNYRDYTVEKFIS